MDEIAVLDLQQQRENWSGCATVNTGRKRNPANKAYSSRDTRERFKHSLNSTVLEYCVELLNVPTRVR